MRTIGKKWKNKIRKIVKNIQKSTCLTGYQEIIGAVIKELPEEIFDTWESAYSEIENYIREVINNE